MDRSMASAFVHRQPYLFWAARAAGGTAQMRSLTRSAWQPDTLESTYFGHSALRETVSSHTRRNVVLVGDREYLLCRGEDLFRPQPCSLKAEAFEFIGDLDHASGVNDVVRRVQDAALDELVLDRLVGQLVVRAAADDARPQAGRGLVVERSAERTGRVNVDLAADQVVAARYGDHLRVARDDALDRCGTDVVGNDLGAVREQVIDQMAA